MGYFYHFFTWSLQHNKINTDDNSIKIVETHEGKEKNKENN